MTSERVTMTPIRAAGAAAAIAATVALGGCGTLSGAAGNSRPANGAPGKGGPAAAVSAHPANAAGVVAALLQDGIGQAGRHQWQAADTTFEDVLAVSPRNVYALYNLGLVDQSTGNPTGAASFYQQALAAKGDYTPAMFNLAILEEKSQPATAISRYQKIIAINPKASTAYLRLAFTYARQGDAAAAKKAQAEAIAIDPALGKYPLPSGR